jgi:hypothetical protein
MGILGHLIYDQIRKFWQIKIVQVHHFCEKFIDLVTRYTNLALTSVDNVAELRVVQNDAAILQFGYDIIKRNTRNTLNIIFNFNQSAIIDWSLKEPMRSDVPSTVRRPWTKYYYPTDHEEKFGMLVPLQAELFLAKSHRKVG